MNIPQREVRSITYPASHVFRGALLGTGQISVYHLRAWSQIKGVEIVALANRTIEKALARADEFGISPDHVYSDHRELLEGEDLDFVDIATLPDVHRVQVEDAAAQGVNVLCQKPMAPSMEDAQAMVEACDHAGVLFSINENWRWRTWYRDLKRLVEEGAVGKPKYIRIVRHTNLTVPRPGESLPEFFKDQPYIMNMERLILYEWGIHLIDVMRFLFGEVNWVFARMDRTSPISIGEDRAYITMDVGGVNCLVDISWGSIGVEKRESQLEQVTLEGNQGSIELLPDEADMLRISNHEGSRTQPAFTGTSDDAYQASYTAAQAHFIGCLREGREPETAARDNIRTLGAMFASYESAAENNVIHLQNADS
ncbi:MAG: gfo/Idh/MocA family oxidoreductase [Chloroflexi bacterium]|nr:MAG: gfo/Idh/MocA family oxidoreductase [Chloroflexota bacterium]